MTPPAKARARRADHTVVQAGPADADVLSQLIADTFTGLAVSQWLITDPQARGRLFPGYFRIFAGHALDDGITDTTPGRDGVALWLPAAVGGPRPPASYTARLAAATRPWTSRFLAFDAALDARHPAGIAHHHLAVLAVHRAGRARASGPRCCAPTTPGSTATPSRPTWKPPARAPAAGICPTAGPITGRRSACPAAR